jgi:hypothetical protein
MLDTVVWSVRGRPLDAVDDQHFHRSAPPVQFEPELLLQGGEDRRRVAVAGGGAAPAIAVESVTTRPTMPVSVAASRAMVMPLAVRDLGVMRVLHCDRSVEQSIADARREGPGRRSGDADTSA